MIHKQFILPAKALIFFCIGFIVAVAGFERDLYTVMESDDAIEVCVVVTNPPPTLELVFDIIMQIFTSRGGTATGTCNYVS